MHAASGSVVAKSQPPLVLFEKSRLTAQNLPFPKSFEYDVDLPLVFTLVSEPPIRGSKASRFRA